MGDEEVAKSTETPQKEDIVQTEEKLNEAPKQEEVAKSTETPQTTEVVQTEEKPKDETTNADGIPITKDVVPNMVKSMEEENNRRRQSAAIMIQSFRRAHLARRTQGL